MRTKRTGLTRMLVAALMAVSATGAVCSGQCYNDVVVCGLAGDAALGNGSCQQVGMTNQRPEFGERKAGGYVSIYCQQGDGWWVLLLLSDAGGTLAWYNPSGDMTPPATGWSPYAGLPGDPANGTPTLSGGNPCGTGTIEVRKVLEPADDNGRFHLYVDGGECFANAGNGDSTGAVVMAAGQHWVLEMGRGTSPATDLGDYLITYVVERNGTVIDSGTAGLDPGWNESESVFFDLNPDDEIVVTFTNTLIYTITASADANGSITPSGAVPLACGGNRSFKISPRVHYRVADVLVDGLSVGAVTSFMFSGVDANHTISATFASDESAVNLAFVPAYPATETTVWSLLTRPVPTTADASGAIVRLPVAYAFGELIEVRIILEDGDRAAVAGADVELDLWKYEPGYDGVGWRIMAFDVPYDPEAGAYVAVIPTDGPDFKLMPGDYEWHLVTSDGRQELEVLRMIIQ